MLNPNVKVRACTDDGTRDEYVFCDRRHQQPLNQQLRAVCHFNPNGRRPYGPINIDSMEQEAEVLPRAGALGRSSVLGSERESTFML